ncbi:hypothetical protein [Leucothrix pacifica]|uniref:hypothetical protein n=1 Tax=Leucothrix pacifica TaxID=1247513 RepID=UPI0015E84BDC|nr:hypothetical protein [Leucothrix pacifica]
MAENYRENERNITRKRASRTHQGPGHWHVEKRSTVIVCQNCEAHIPKWKNPKYCPECGEGKL